MIASAQTAKDVAKYYQGTYIKIPEFDATRVFYLRSVTTAGMVVLDEISAEEGIIDFKDDFHYNIQSPLETQRRWFTYDKHAYLIERVPARMWKKGVCSENTVIHRLGAKGDLSSVSINATNLNASLVSAYDTNAVKRHSVAFDDRFALATNVNQVYLWDQLIGRYVPRTKEMFLFRELAGLPLPAPLNAAKVLYV